MCLEKIFAFSGKCIGKKFLAHRQLKNNHRSLKVCGMDFTRIGQAIKNFNAAMQKSWSTSRKKMWQWLCGKIAGWLLGKYQSTKNNRLLEKTPASDVREKSLRKAKLNSVICIWKMGNGQNGIIWSAFLKRAMRKMKMWSW